jgi:hypothetical protein
LDLAKLSKLAAMTPARCRAVHSKIVDTLASTSSITASGRLSSFLPPRDGGDSGEAER